MKKEKIERSDLLENKILKQLETIKPFFENFENLGKQNSEIFKGYTYPNIEIPEIFLDASKKICESLAYFNSLTIAGSVGDIRPISNFSPVVNYDFNNVQTIRIIISDE